MYIEFRSGLINTYGKISRNNPYYYNIIKIFFITFSQFCAMFNNPQHKNFYTIKVTEAQNSRSYIVSANSKFPPWTPVSIRLSSFCTYALSLPSKLPAISRVSIKSICVLHPAYEPPSNFPENKGARIVRAPGPPCPFYAAAPLRALCV